MGARWNEVVLFPRLAGRFRLFLLPSTTLDSVKDSRETNAIDRYHEKTKFTCEKEWWGLGGGSVGTVPALQTQGPEFEPWNPYKSWGTGDKAQQ